LTRIINQLLDWSRIDVGRIELQPESLPIYDFVKDIVESVQTLADEKSITLQVLPCEGLSAVRADRDKVEQILWNLVGNAIKFTPNGGKVSVEFHRRDDDFAEIRIIDTGCGIAPHEIPKVFNEFSKVESSIPSSQGAQLGLFITKSLVRLHGGEIWVKSQLGQGATFTFTLPVKPWPTS